MKSFFRMFTKSAAEFKSIRCITLTGILIAVSMLIEMHSIDLEFFKINFAFLAIAAVGMLFGPTVSLFAGFAGDIVGFMVHPSGGFIPAYVLAAGLQGLIYGICLYHKSDKHSLVFVNNVTGKKTDITLYVRAVAARLLDIIIINLLINTKLNLHYGFIPEQAYTEAVITRIGKNLIELFADLPLLFVILPVVLLIYKKLPANKSSKASA